MQTPDVIGRMADDDTLDGRAGTKLLRQVKIPFEGGAVGELLVSVFRSTDNEDRGGLVLRLELTDLASSFIPHAFDIEKGVELHLAGDIESQSLARGLREALSEL